MRKTVLLGKVNTDFLNLETACYVYESYQAHYLRIVVSPDKESLRLIIPYGLKNKEKIIRETLKQKQNWIKKHLKKLGSMEQGPRLPAAPNLQSINFAKDYIVRHTNELAKRYGFIFNKIYIRNQKTRWGSCSAKKNLSFNWRLILLPEELAEYIIYHELVHLKHPNHSIRFWQELKKYCPQSDIFKKYLKNYRLSWKIDDQNNYY